MSPNKSRLFLGLLVGFVVAIGIIFRFYNITDNQYMFYDEGMYLNHNRVILQAIENHTPNKPEDIQAIQKTMFKSAFMTPKPVWFYLANQRIWMMPFSDGYFLRILSAIFGVLTLGATYALARRYYDDKWIGLSSICILAVLPSHVFYSKLALQESISVFFFTLAVYFFVTNRSLWKAGLAGVCLTIVLWCNYRLIIAPVLLIAWETVLVFTKSKPLDWKRPVVMVSVIAVAVICASMLSEGRYSYVTFGWMGQQASNASSGFHILNIFSYPYYLFRLDGFVLGLCFFASLFFMKQKKWMLAAPVIVVLIHMALFSLPAEKGARYLAVVLPIIAMVTASVVDSFKKDPATVKVLSVVLIGTLAWKSWPLAQMQNDSQKAVEFVKSENPNEKFVSTMPTVHNLYVLKPTEVAPLGKTAKELLNHLSQGYRYLLIDPQVYISWGKDGVKFADEHSGYLQYLTDKMEPIQSFPHLNQPLLERFVFEHSENLVQSVKFLDEHHSVPLDIYDLQLYAVLLQQTLGERMKNL